MLPSIWVFDIESKRSCFPYFVMSIYLTSINSSLQYGCVEKQGWMNLSYFTTMTRTSILGTWILKFTYSTVGQTPVCNSEEVPDGDTFFVLASMHTDTNKNWFPTNHQTVNAAILKGLHNSILQKLKLQWTNH